METTGRRTTFARYIRERLVWTATNGTVPPTQAKPCQNHLEAIKWQVGLIETGTIKYPYWMCGNTLVSI